MESFTTLTATAAPLPTANIDTDIIFPARFLLLTTKTGLGRYAFHDWRYGPDGEERADFVLNQGPYREARILIAGDNFGCGSSREQAVWALRGLGVRCVISTSFGEIFHANCFKNGVLPIVETPEHLDGLMEDAQAGRLIEIDLGDQKIRRRDQRTWSFDIDPFQREAMLKGWDEIAVILNQDAARIADFETAQKALRPWLHQGE